MISIGVSAIIAVSYYYILGNTTAFIMPIVLTVMGASFIIASKLPGPPGPQGPTGNAGPQGPKGKLGGTMTFLLATNKNKSQVNNVGRSIKFPSVNKSIVDDDGPIVGVNSDRYIIEPGTYMVQFSSSHVKIDPQTTFIYSVFDSVNEVDICNREIANESTSPKIISPNMSCIVISTRDRPKQIQIVLKTVGGNAIIGQRELFILKLK